ncbi:MAG TPA: leucine-rich repeat domain-containing protein, partial [Firmicutes bacterium]|nr:leucine-rich repeat domain-containing protein [Bacillota bacterium]
DRVNTIMIVILAVIVVLLLAALIYYFAGYSRNKGEGVVVDFNLLTALQDRLGKTDGTLTDEDWARLETVKILGRSIKELEGFQQADNLRELNLRCNKIGDLSPLSGLTRLELLVAADNEIKDISRLNGPVLEGLKHLDLSINRIDDLAVLDWKKLEALTHLDIRYNYIDLQDSKVKKLIGDLRERGVEVLCEPMY